MVMRGERVAGERVGKEGDALICLAVLPLILSRG